MQQQIIYVFSFFFSLIHNVIPLKTVYSESVEQDLHDHIIFITLSLK